MKYEIYKEGSSGTREEDGEMIVVLKLRPIERTKSVWVEAVDSDGHKVDDGLLVGFMPNGKLRRGHHTSDELGFELTMNGKLLKLDNKEADYQVATQEE